MNGRALLLAGVVLLGLGREVSPARAAPEWLGLSRQGEGKSFTRCTGPAWKFIAAYRGEADGSSPAVGDVYPILFSFQNLGGCVGTNLGETAYGFDVEFSLPGRHLPVHDFKYEETTHRIQCFLTDPAGNRSELVGEKCAIRLSRRPGGDTTVDTLGGFNRFLWKVPMGHTLEVIIPVIARTPVLAQDGGFTVNVELQLNSLGYGYDYFDLAPPVVVASSPLEVKALAVEDLTSTGVRLFADFYPRFIDHEIYFQIEPAPMFDSIRVGRTGDQLNRGRYRVYWGDLTPDTDYRWRAGIVAGNAPVIGEGTFRTPPATMARRVTAQQGPAGQAGPTLVAPAERPAAGACSAAGAGGAGSDGGRSAGWSLGLATIVLGLMRRRSPRGLWLAAAALLLTACPGGEAAPVDAASTTTDAQGLDPAPAVDGGITTPVDVVSGGRLPLTFLRAQPGLFTVPAGWQVNESSLRAWQVEHDHVVTLSPPGNPAVVLGVRQVLTPVRPARLIQLAAMPAEVVEVLENKSGAGDGLHARWLARVTLNGKPAVMGMYSWATLADDQGSRLVLLAALLTPTLTEFELMGGLDSLRRMAYGQGSYEDGAPDVLLAGKYTGAEGTGSYYDPYTGQFSDSGFGMSMTLTGDQITVQHHMQVSVSAGTPSTSIAATRATGTFIRSGGMIVPSWNDCFSEVILNGQPGGRLPCPAGWGATIHMIPRSDGSFLARMPGMETAGDIDEPGTVVMRPAK